MLIVAQLKIVMSNHCFHSWQLCALLFQRKSIKSHKKPIKIQIFLSLFGFVCDFIDSSCEFTVKTKEHTVASYESSDFT
jgi:hypothetical protein